MTPEVLDALRRIVAVVGADAGALLRMGASGTAVVASSTLAPHVTVGDAWGAPGVLRGRQDGPELVLDADRLSALVPTAARSALPAAVTAVLLAPLAETRSRLVLLWAQTPVPDDVIDEVESGSSRRLALLAPLLDAQVLAREAASRLNAVVAALDQAVVLTSAGGGTVEVNAAAEMLLGVRRESVDAGELSKAMRALRARAVDPAALEGEAERLLASPDARVRDWIWALRGAPSHLRVSTVPAENVTGPGRVWVFDDISAEMGLIDSERRAGSALTASEERYRVVAENVSDVVVQTTVDSVITWVSPSVAATMGWNPSELVDTLFFDLVHPADLPEVELAQPALGRGEPVAFEVRLRTAGGDFRWMSVRLKPTLDADGRVVGRVAAWWDRHAAHEAAEQLAASERRYRLLLDHTAEVVFQTADGVLTWVSPALEAVTGWQPEALIGSPILHLWHPDDRARALALREDVHPDAGVSEVLRFRRPDERYVWMEVVARPYVEPDGSRGLVAMMYDVTARVVAQEAARVSEERYRTVAENASDVVCCYRADGVIDWVAGSTETLAGYDAEELVGAQADSLVVTEDLGDRDQLRAQLERGETVRTMARLRRSDGGTRWVELRAKAVIAPDGSIEYVITTWRDAQAEVEYRDALAASEQQAQDLADAYQAARNEANAANAAKTMFLSRMSHELRTPLNAVLGFAQLLALDPLTQDQTQAVQHIRRGGLLLLDLINEVLDIARIETGRLSLSMEVVDARAVVAEVVALLQPLAGAHEVSVTTVDPDGPSVHVQADQQRVKQVLINLLTNGVKYNHTGGSVQVGCRARDSGEVAFDVTDTGPGLPAELLPRLFQAFDRLGAESTDVEGTGLGLALADGLARAMGGRIEVLTAPGAGSTFTLVLLESATEAGLTETVQREPEVPVERDQRILLVEDNPTNATLMSRVVALRPGCRLEVARDGAQGLAAARREVPVLVFLDLHLPDMDGEQVLRELRTVPSCADVPVVVVTADASPGARKKMAELGSSGFLTKPIDLDDVLGWIDHALGEGGEP